MSADNDHVEWVTRERLAALTGLSKKAIDRKRERKVWLEEEIWRKIDGGIFYSIRAYNLWVAGLSFQVSNNTGTPSASPLRIRRNAAASN